MPIYTYDEIDNIKQYKGSLSEKKNNSHYEYLIPIGIKSINFSDIISIKDKVLKSGQMLYDTTNKLLRIGNNINKIEELPVYGAPQEDNTSDGKILVRNNNTWQLVDG